MTLLEGNAALLRGTGRYGLAEGVRLERGDVVELGDKALAQVEFADGTLIALGPQARLLALSYPTHAGRTAGGGELFLLRGWMKLTRPKTEPRIIVRFGNPVFELTTTEGVAVLHIDASGAAVFMEGGEGRVATFTRSGHTEDPIRLKGSQFYAAKPGQRGTIGPRPPPAFVSGMPRSFMDTLPPRLAKFKERSVAPKRTGEFTYAEVEDWLNSLPPVRRTFVGLWHSKIHDSAFRSAIAANMRDHPEWDRLLNPEKYESPPGSTPTGPGGSEGK